MISRRTMIVGSAALASGLWATERQATAALRRRAAPIDVNAILQPILAKYDLPALAGAILTGENTVAIGAIGVRKYGDPTPVTINDPFHLGSDTKSMTSTLVGMLVEKGKLAWSSTIGAVFPELVSTMDPGYRDVTIDDLLADQAGLTSDSWPVGKNYIDMWNLPGSPEVQRRAYLATILQEPPVSARETTFLYANRSFIVLGMMAERAAGIPWERLMEMRLFKPLGMTTAGFGTMGTPGTIDAPWQHTLNGTTHVPIPPGPRVDNPPILGPAGTVHCSMSDWAKYVSMHIRGARGQSGLLKTATIQRLHTPLFGGSYVAGWIPVQQAWGGGTVLTHSGSNTQNYAVVWMAPIKDFAVLAATNQGGDAASSACNDVSIALIQRYTGG